MHIKSNCFFFLLALMVAYGACNTQEKSCASGSSIPKKIINPNGDSELALLMRAMYDEADKMKQQLAKGDAVSLSIDHDKILTAHATEPEKAGSEMYKAFAANYLQSIERLKTGPNEQIPGLYTQMVQQCKNCHQELCPGPLVRIQKLMLP